MKPEKNKKRKRYVRWHDLAGKLCPQVCVDPSPVLPRFSEGKFEGANQVTVSEFFRSLRVARGGGAGGFSGLKELREQNKRKSWKKKRGDARKIEEKHGRGRGVKSRDKENADGDGFAQNLVDGEAARKIARTIKRILKAHVQVARRKIGVKETCETTGIRAKSRKRPSVKPGGVSNTGETADAAGAKKRKKDRKSHQCRCNTGS